MSSLNTEITRLHAQMIRNVFLNTELLLNDHIQELSEYDIQGMMFLAFRYSLAPTVLHATREAEGKMDCVLYEGNVPRVIYEIKTYFKRHEKLQEAHFKKDLSKLHDRLVEMEGARGYFVVAGKCSKFNDPNIALFRMVNNHLRDNSRSWFLYAIDDHKKIRLRPSKKENYGRSVVLTWEVKLSN